MNNLDFGDSLSDSFYKTKLVNLYESATGKTIDRRNIHDIQNIIKYYIHLNEVKDMYKDFLVYNDVDINSKKTVEIDVGVLDSVLKDNGATIVTPYEKQFKDREGLVFIGAHFVKDGDIEMISHPSRKFEIDTAPLEIGKGRVYLTQNLLKKNLLNSYRLLSMNKDNRVVVGVYGFLSDRNMNDKMKMLEDFAEDNNFKKEYHTDEKRYCMVIKNR